MIRSVAISTFMGFVALAAAFGAVSARAQEQGGGTGSGASRENLMKACGDKWRGVRETESANGVTWPQFLARCRADSAAPRGPAAQLQAQAVQERETQAQTTLVPRSSASAAAPRDQRGGSVPARASVEPVFPEAISQRHASERPALARQRTCADQFRANKASEANGGLRWIEQGGGYWSQCNARLKQARA